MIKYIANEIKNSISTSLFLLVIIGYILFLVIPFYQELLFERTHEVNIAYIWTVSTNHTSISLALSTIVNLFVADFIARDIRQGVLQYTLPRMGRRKYFLSKILICISLSFLIVVLSNAIVIFFLGFSFPLITTPIESNNNILYGLSNGFLIREHAPIWFYAWLVFKQAAEMTCMILISLVVSIFSQNKLILFTVPLVSNVVIIFLDKVKLLPFLLDPRRIFSMYNYLGSYFGNGDVEQSVGLATAYPIFYLMMVIFIVYMLLIFIFKIKFGGGYR
ncbi:hypothetical protein [Ruoffia tabacinasalis]|uniref:hypothetical protein n=1 Tax=Ruoffia tabacinasalis TaxID=87458 RepID=UPI0030D5897C